MEDKRRDRFKFTRTKTESLVFTGFIKSTDHRPTDHRPLTHRPTDQPTTNPPTHRPNWQDPISKTWSMKNIHFTERKHSWDDVKL